MQYCIIINDIALIMHYRALLQMPGRYISLVIVNIYPFPKETKVATSVKFGILEDDDTAEVVVNKWVFIPWLFL